MIVCSIKFFLFRDSYRYYLLISSELEFHFCEGSNGSLRNLRKLPLDFLRSFSNFGDGVDISRRSFKSWLTFGNCRDGVADESGAGSVT